ncbi:MAG TPA: TetR family transcriptional regulator [Mycobacteriales bacterium]
MTTYAGRMRAQLREEALDVVAAAVIAGDYSLSMAALAARTGVSRQTLYNEFSNREGLLTALADRENSLLLTRVLEELDAHGEDIVAAVSAAAEAALRMATDNVLHKALLSGETSTVGLLVAHGESLLLRSQAELAAFMLARFPALDPDDTHLLVHVVARFVQSHLLLPHEPPEVVAAQISRLVERYLAGGPAGANRTFERVIPRSDGVAPDATDSSVHQGGTS